jgi:hypothetical protein
MAHWLLGADVEAATASAPVASAALAAVGDVDTVQGLARWSGGRAMTVDLTRSAGHRDSIRPSSSASGAAVLEFTDTGKLVVRAGGERDVTRLGAADVLAEALATQLTDFARAASAGAPSAATAARDSHRALLAAIALREARRTGGWRSP